MIVFADVYKSIKEDPDQS